LLTVVDCRGVYYRGKEGCWIENVEWWVV
jgi:hypothetical protein